MTTSPNSAISPHLWRGHRTLRIGSEREPQGRGLATVDTETRNFRPRRKPLLRLARLALLQRGYTIRLAATQRARDDYLKYLLPQHNIDITERRN